jgi:N-acetylmuramoyl-L-alanine amidase
MPSILVETGYITNRGEEDYLNSEKGQTEIASCITGALKTYVSWLEKHQTPSDNLNTAVPQKKHSDKEAYTFLKAVAEQERRRTSR